MRKSKPEFDRFISKVEKTPSCWIWRGSKYRGGYGQFRRKIDGVWKMAKTHRYSYEVFTGSIPSNLIICHTCDNPSCVNPLHLFAGTTQDNHRDMMSKNRWKLIRNPKHNLLNMNIANQIREYKKLNPQFRLLDIQQKFKTSKQQISRILRNEIWVEEN
jgi:hypothetical protein